MKANKPEERIHFDFMGPMQEFSLGGSRYVLVFTNDFSQKSWTYFLKEKNETLAKFYAFKKKIEAKTGNNIQVLQLD